MLRVGPLIAPLGASTVAAAMTPATSSICKPNAANLVGSTCTRTAGFCWPPIDTCAMPGICEICCARIFSA
jgi:hypothetical protein